MAFYFFNHRTLLKQTMDEDKFFIELGNREKELQRQINEADAIANSEFPWKACSMYNDLSAKFQEHIDWVREAGPSGALMDAEFVWDAEEMLIIRDQILSELSWKRTDS